MYLSVLIVLQTFIRVITSEILIILCVFFYGRQTAIWHFCVQCLDVADTAKKCDHLRRVLECEHTHSSARV